METLSKQEINDFAIKEENINNGGLYECNVIVQCFSNPNAVLDDERYLINPTNYMPRKESCYEYMIDLRDESAKNAYLVHLRDSQERLKILAALLHKQEVEIEKYGYPMTSVYYPEFKHEED